MSPLDKPIEVTWFPHRTGRTKQVGELTLREIGAHFPRVKKESKNRLPTLKLQTYGDKKTANGCLRNNENVERLTGLEVDYDGAGSFAGAHAITMKQAQEIFERAKVAALITPSWSYTGAEPAWHAYLPMNKARKPKERDALMARVNGLFDGEIDQHASFTLSQASFFGRPAFVNHPAPLFAEGRFIDECNDLDAGALPKQMKARERTRERVRDESRSGRFYMAALEAVRAGKNYDDLVEEIDDDLRDYAESKRCAGETHGEKDWRKAMEIVRAESDAITAKLKDFGDDEGDSNSADESDFLTAEQMAELARPFDFLEGLLFEQQLSMVYGPPKAGKSFLIMDMACAVGLGRMWAGRQCDPRKVLVIPLEGRGTIIDRVRAWEIEHKAKCPLIFRPKPLDLINGAKDVKAIIRYVKKRGVGLVIIDTLSRAIPGAEENSATDMSKAVRVADMICRAGAHTMLVHHANKAGMMRGSNALIGAPDLVIKLNREGEQRTAIIEENRHGKDGEVLRFTLEPRRTDIVDARGKTVHSAVVKLEGEWFEDHDAKDFGPKDDATIALDVLRRLTRIPRSYPNGVPATDWREQLDHAGLWPDADNPATRRSCFKRAKDRLVKAGLVTQTDDGFKPVEAKPIR